MILNVDELKEKVKGRFQPVYVVNDWGSKGWFVGTNYVTSRYGTHSNATQTDFRIDRACMADVRWPDGTEERVRVECRSRRVVISDMGHDSHTSTIDLYVRCKVRGAETEIDLDQLLVDPTSVVFDRK